MIKSWGKLDKATPWFTEDCDKCKFLFTVATLDNQKIDVYKQCGTREAYLFRFGNDGADYSSGYTLDMLLQVVAVHLADRKDKI
jgi:hypothetical protein